MLVNHYNLGSYSWAFNAWCWTELIGLETVSWKKKKKTPQHLLSLSGKSQVAVDVWVMTLKSIQFD